MSILDSFSKYFKMQMDWIKHKSILEKSVSISTPVVTYWIKINHLAIPYLIRSKFLFIPSQKISLFGHVYFMHSK